MKVDSFTNRNQHAYLVCVHIYADQKYELSHEKAAAQVLVDGGPGALDLTEEPKGENAHEEADD